MGSDSAGGKVIQDPTGSRPLGISLDIPNDGTPRDVPNTEYKEVRASQISNYPQIFERHQ